MTALLVVALAAMAETGVVMKAWEWHLNDLSAVPVPPFWTLFGLLTAVGMITVRVPRSQREVDEYSPSLVALHTAVTVLVAFAVIWLAEVMS